MTRNEYDEIEGVAQVAMLGLLSGDAGWAHDPAMLAERSFDIAEAFQAKKKQRPGGGNISVD